MKLMKTLMAIALKKFRLVLIERSERSLSVHHAGLHASAQPTPIEWDSHVKTLLLFVSMIFLNKAILAANSSINQTKTQLQAVNQQISTLKQTLNHAQDKRSVLNTELAKTEKQISEAIRKSRLIQQTSKLKQNKITQLQGQLTLFNKQLATQQQLLAQHVRTRYILGEYQPLKWLINQDDPNAISQLLTLYQYLIQSRQHVIDNIDTTQKNISLHQQQLMAELTELKQLQKELQAHQQTLVHNKQYHTVLIQSLDNDIQNKSHALSSYEHNKEHLSALLKTLVSQQATLSNTAFPHMQRKLPLPVAVSKQSIRKMHQGLTIFAAEGTPVTAVYPGKVVFSDWLKGFGLLIILDHGQGFMTLYAHNQSLFKEKGSTVLQGEQIAIVGHTGGIKQTALYFEVRRYGKAVPPLEWLV